MSSRPLVCDVTVSGGQLLRPRSTLARLDVLPFIILYAVLINVAGPALEYSWREIPTAVNEITNTTLINATYIDNATTITNETIPPHIQDSDQVTKPDINMSHKINTTSTSDTEFPEVESFIAMAGLPITMLLHALTYLGLHWSRRWESLIRYTSATSNATHIRVDPAPHCGSAAIVPMQSTTVDGQRVQYFIFQKIKFFATSPLSSPHPSFSPVSLPITYPLSHYQNHVGFPNPTATGSAAVKYGPNIFDIPLPTFNELFAQHAVAPFFVFQIFCVLLWCLDEYWYYSVMTLFMLVVFEATVVKRRLKHLEDLREMRIPPHKIQVHRNGRWVEVMSDTLLPGDLISLTRSTGDMVSPCDLLLISGSCVANEALLTGESVPQIKESIEILPGEDLLSINKEHKRNLVFGGTKILLTHPAIKLPEGVKPPPNQGCLGYVLRTGFNSSQGKLVRTILFSTEHVNVNNAESLLFIGFLLIFAVIASGYVLMRGLEDATRSRYKLMLNCIMIITSVVPPELPMELSLAVNTSLMHLVKQQIYCTEPFRIPLAGAVDVCCFDKTGTLTSDNFMVRGVSGISPVDSDIDRVGRIHEIVECDKLPDNVKYVIAGCHALALIDSTLVGDPLEKSSFRAIQYTYGKGDVAVARHGGARVRILHRYPFSSQLKRMSCIVVLDHQQDAMMRVVSKGAAEVMQSRFRSIPPDYEDRHAFFSRQGCRVLALGYKILKTRDIPDERKLIRTWTREEMESDLEFAGFLVLQCPMKPDSFETVQHLIASSHRVIMITGDNTLTACHVSSELGITSRPTLIATHRVDRNDVVWISPDGKTVESFDTNLSNASITALASRYDLCVSGDTMEHLLQHHIVTPEALGRLIVFVSVFARTSPDQKESILTWLKQAGLTTLMCGDGTNDVGALKQAHIGVALIGNEDIKSPGNALTVGGVAGQTNTSSPASIPAAAATKGRPVRGAPATAPTPPANQTAPANRVAALQQQMAKLQSEMDEEEKATTVRLGDASIASPFTSKVPYITATTHIIRQGRCTLVTTLQMFNILGINCLISAYSMSVLYLDGVKLGDTQMTLAGLSIAMFFLFISRSQPLDRLSPERPHSRLFTVYMMLSVIGQFAIHTTTLILAVMWSKPHTPTDEETRSPEGKFAPNVLNTVVYLIATSSTVATFAANYRGRPFMMSLTENRLLCRGLFGMYVLMLILAADIIQPLNDFMELAPLPSVEFRASLIGLMLADLILAWSYSYGLQRMFAITPKRTPTSQIPKTITTPTTTTPH